MNWTRLRRWRLAAHHFHLSRVSVSAWDCLSRSHCSNRSGSFTGPGYASVLREFRPRPRARRRESVGCASTPAVTLEHRDRIMVSPLLLNQVRKLRAIVLGRCSWSLPGRRLFAACLQPKTREAEFSSELQLVQDAARFRRSARSGRHQTRETQLAEVGRASVRPATG